jgi:cell division protease FtsH
MEKITMGDDIRPDWIARGTPGFSGAELANLVNESALTAARESKDKVSMADFEKAKDKLLMGSERKSMAMTEKEKSLTAYHEAGHAIVGKLMPEHDPVYKVSIIPRGRALGVTMYMPNGDAVSQSRLILQGRLCSIFGGRLAEELIFGYDHVTTGASNDIQVATNIARNYVARWGLSDKMGTVLYDVEEDGPFGPQGSRGSKVSDETIREVDTEVRKLIETSYAKAKTLLEDNLDILHAMADALMKYETIDARQVDDLIARKDVREPGDYGDSYKPTDESHNDDSDTKSKDSNSEAEVVGVTPQD